MAIEQRGGPVAPRRSITLQHALNCVPLLLLSLIVVIAIALVVSVEAGLIDKSASQAIALHIMKSIPLLSGLMLVLVRRVSISFFGKRWVLDRRRSPVVHGVLVGCCLLVGIFVALT